MRAGDVVRLGDGRGRTASATVVALTKAAVTLQIDAIVVEAPPTLAVTLAFAVPRLARTEWLLEHGTELGITVFQPLWTERTRPQGERPERWQRIVQAAAGQCDRAYVPLVLPAIELNAWLSSPVLPTHRLLASADGARGGMGLPDCGEVALLVGPEGGFTVAERTHIATTGFVPRRLGPHVLRTETAALVGAALLLAQ
jgi:16S rRNA (uracil1498-N3)-methyltransferase